MIRRTEKYTRHLQRLKDRFSAFVSRPEIREKAERLRAEIADRKKEGAEIDPEELERMRYRFQFTGPLHRSDFLRLVYEETGNTLFAWRAYREALEHNFEVPDWVHECLLETARNLTDIKEPGRAAGAIQQATGIDGKHFSELHKTEKRFRVYEFIENLRRGREAGQLEADEGMEDFLSAAAEKFGMKRETVRKIYYGLRRSMEKCTQL